MNPKIIVLDEPTSMLDFAGRTEVLKIITTLNREQKTTVIYITHFVEEAIETDRVIIMQNGKIFQEGVPKKILSNPLRLKDWGINPLPINQLAVKLSRAGLNLSTTVLGVEDMVKALCSLN